MKDELISPQSSHRRYRGLLSKHPGKIGFSEREFRDYLIANQCFQDDCIKISAVDDDCKIQLSDIVIQRKDWYVCPKDKPIMEKRLRGAE